MGLTPEDIKRLGPATQAAIQRQRVDGVKKKRKDYSKDEHNQSQALLAQQVRLMKLPTPLRDYGRRREDKAPWYPRRWEADFAWIDTAAYRYRDAPYRFPEDDSRDHLAVFVEGQVHAIKHQRPKDCERMNVLGLTLGPAWTIFTFTPSQVRDLVAIDAITAWLKGDMDATLEALQRKTR